MCKAHHVKRIHVFGSHTSGTATSRSDVDLLVKFDRDGYEVTYNSKKKSIARSA
ncbi:MAG: nucleotidyltransferase domain-containing protein [Verrucomicrobiota bacterium]